MENQVVLNETVYMLLVDYQRAYRVLLETKKAAQRLIYAEPETIIEPSSSEDTLLNEILGEVHTVEKEITTLEKKILVIEERLSDLSQKATFDLQYFIELRDPKFSVHFEAYIISKRKVKNSDYEYILKNVQTDAESIFPDKPSLIDHLVKEYEITLQERNLEPVQYVTNHLKYV